MTVGLGFYSKKNERCLGLRASVGSRQAGCGQATRKRSSTGRRSRRLNRSGCNKARFYPEPSHRVSRRVLHVAALGKVHLVEESTAVKCH